MKFTEFKLYGKEIGGSMDFYRIFDSMRFQDVKAINLQNCDFEVKKLREELKGYNDVVHSLKIEYISQLDKGNLPEDNFPKIKDASRHKQKLKKEDIEHLLGILGENPGIEVLALNNHISESLDSTQNNFLEDDALLRLLEYLQGNNTIKTLYLNGHFFTRQTAHFLKCFLENNRTIEFLDLASCNLCDKLGYISEALESNKTLKSLCLNRNQISNLEAVKDIVWLIEGDNNLQELYLRDNSLSSEGAGIIFAALRNNKKLKVLNIGNNDILYFDMDRALADMVTQNKTLQRLCLLPMPNTSPCPNLPKFAAAMACSFSSLAVDFPVCKRVPDSVAAHLDNKKNANKNCIYKEDRRRENIPKREGEGNQNSCVKRPHVCFLS